MRNAARKVPARAKRGLATSKERILEAATNEFAAKGYDGARVDEIAKASEFNKNALYHYFGSKENLFVAVLEHAYATIRTRQSDLEIRGMDPEEGMRHLIEFTARTWIEMPEFNRLLASENLHGARHVRQSKRIPEMYDPLLETLRELLKRGAEAGKFRDDVDAIDLYISISALSAYYISHRHTFEAIFKKKMFTKARLRQRIDHASDVILCFLRKT